MTEPTKKSTRITTSIWVAIIGIIGVIIAAFIGILPQIIKSKPVELSISVHVSNQNGGTSIQGAKTMLFLEGSPFIEFTDTNGISTFDVTTPTNSRARLFVETSQYEIYDSNIQLKKNQIISIQLTPKGANNKKIIVRVVDGENGEPIDGVNVVLIESGNSYSESTDSNGLAKFTITFDSDQIETDISVSTSSYTINRQKVTLRPDEVQDILLNPEQGDLEIKPFDPQTPISSDSSNNLRYGDLITGSLSVPAEIDKYTFTGRANDAILISLVRTSGEYWPQIRLFSPDGTEINGAKSGGTKTQITQTLTVTGEYVIFVEDGWNGTSTGDYSLTIQQTN